ncbi:MAG: DUF6784 domain-containing protein [Armatimonadota bacterium]
MQSGHWFATGFGFGVALILAAARRQFVGFPLHPLAYAVANSWGMHNLWLPIMIGSISKSLCLKILSLKGYRLALMLFFGLMLGEITIGGFWILLGILLDRPMYQFWP